jgi:hypothetical protein
MLEATMVCPNPECPDLDGSGVPGEYVVGTTACPYCGTPLVEARPESDASRATIEPKVPDQRPELEPVFQTDDPAEIQIVRTILSGADIPHTTTHDSASDRVLPGFDPFRFLRGSRDAVFWVPAEFAEEARALLTETDPVDPEGGK